MSQNNKRPLAKIDLKPLGVNDLKIACNVFGINPNGHSPQELRTILAKRAGSVYYLGKRCGKGCWVHEENLGTKENTNTNTNTNNTSINTNISEERAMPRNTDTEPSKRRKQETRQPESCDIVGDVIASLNKMHAIASLNKMHVY